MVESDQDATFQLRLIPSVPLPSIVVMSSSNLSFNSAGTSHVSSNLDNAYWSPLFVSSNLIGRIFPIPLLNALVVSK